MFPLVVEGLDLPSRSDSKKENENAWYDPAGDFNSDASWLGPYLATQQKLGLWSKWRTGDHFCDPADSGLARPYLRIPS